MAASKKTKGRSKRTAGWKNASGRTPATSNPSGRMLAKPKDDSGGQWHVLEPGGHGKPTLRVVDDLSTSDRERYLLVDANLVVELAGKAFPETTPSAKESATERYSAVLDDLHGRLGSLATVLAEMLRLAPTTQAGNPLADAIGPCWTTSQTEHATATTRQNLSDVARRHRGVRLQSANGTYWWPTFQFRRVGGRVRFDVGIQRLWQSLPHGTFDEWDLAAWMLQPRHDLNGRRPVDLAVDAKAVEQGALADVVDEISLRAGR